MTLNPNQRARFQRFVCVVEGHNHGDIGIDDCFLKCHAQMLYSTGELEAA